MTHRLSHLMIALFATAAVLATLTALPDIPPDAEASHNAARAEGPALADAETRPARPLSRRIVNPQRAMPYFSFGGLLPRRES